MHHRGVRKQRTATTQAARRGDVAEDTANETPATVAERSLAPRLKQTRLDLLPVLHELLRTRSVTRTARSLGITQPAVSQALQRLRERFGDDLLVSLGRDLQPTDRAEALARPLRNALEEIDALLLPARPFDPATEALHVVITTADYVSLLLAPILLQICATEAPEVVFEFIEGGVRNADDLARVDFFIAPRAYGHTLGKRIGSMPLWQDDVVCIAAARNAAIPPRITPEAFRRLRQAAYQRNPRIPEQVRLLLQPTSVLETRRVCTLPDFLVLGAVVDPADCVALVPRKMANQLVRWRDLKIVELAYANRHLAIDAYWSLAANGRRGHPWCQTLLARAASGIARPMESETGREANHEIQPRSYRDQPCRQPAAPGRTYRGQPGTPIGGEVDEAQFQAQLNPPWGMWCAGRKISVSTLPVTANSARRWGIASTTVHGGAIRSSDWGVSICLGPGLRDRFPARAAREWC